MRPQTKNLLVVSIIAFLFAVVSSILHAEGFEVPQVDPFAALMDLITQWSALSPVLIGSSIITILVQLSKQFIKGDNPAFKKGLILGLGILYAIFQSVSGGLGWLPSLGLVLLTSGGAVAIYEWIVKPLLPKKA